MYNQNLSEKLRFFYDWNYLKIDYSQNDEEILFYFFFIAMKKYFLKATLLLMGLMGTLAMWVVNAQEINKDIILEATSTEANQTLKINKYFANAYTVDRWDGSPVENLTEATGHVYSVISGYTITLSLTGGASRWTFYENSKTLVPMSGTTMTWVKITYMPSLADWFWPNATSVGNYFFYRFNSEWAITSLPIWSFDTSHITTVWVHFFSSFNNSWKLATLPAWSFDISNITSVGMSFFMGFNMDWSLTSLPAWSFNFSTWLTSAANYFFFHFNDGWKLTNLPAWSFDTSKLTSASSYFFANFNRNWQLTSLSTWSFNLSRLTTAGGYFFYEFNNAWQLTSLPTWSFSFTWITEVNDSFFRRFNSYWKLTSLPAWSFDISNITKVGNRFFNEFNWNWKIGSLPAWSFDMSHITSGGTYFLASFNQWWSITDLPDSFKLTSIGYDKSYGYSYAFSSPSYTLNKNVYDLVDGLSEPTTDRNTFSDNQPWRCGVHVNRLVNSAGVCYILYDANWWEWIIITWWYISNVTWVVPWSWIVSPTRDWYSLSGWLDVSWSNVDEILFPDMNGQILYAQWVPINYWIKYELSDGIVKWINATWYTIESDDITLINPTKTWYTFTWRSGTDLEWITWTVTISKWSTWDRTYEANWEANEYEITIDIDGNETILTWKYGDHISKPADPSKNGYKFIGWELEFPTIMPLSGATVKAKWEKLWSSGGWGGRSSRTSDKDKDTTNNPSVTDVTAPLESGAQWDGNDGSPLSRGDTASAERGSTQNYTPEFISAYEFAKEKGITTMPTINEAQVDGKLTRIAMAKMLSYYAINVLWQKPDETRINKFNDITEKLDAQYDSGVTLAYQLWIMWINMPNNNFRPDDEVPRAEFATALSRMIYKMSDWEYESTPKYYIHHMEKLVKEWIITNDDPMMKELRGYVMIMLMRSAK